MKKVLFLFGIYLITSAQLCTAILRTNDAPAPGGIRLLSQTRIEALNSNFIKKNATYDRTISFDLKEEFKTRFKIDVNKLQSFTFQGVSAWFSRDECRKLASYNIKITMPDGTVFADSSNTTSPCSLTRFGGSVGVAGAVGGTASLLPPGTYGFIDIDADSKIPELKKAITTDYAQAIKDGKKVTVTLKLKAGEDIPVGFGVTALAIFEARYQP